MRHLDESDMRELELLTVLLDQLMEYKEKDEQFYHTEPE